MGLTIILDYVQNLVVVIISTLSDQIYVQISKPFESTFSFIHAFI